MENPISEIGLEATFNPITYQIGIGAKLKLKDVKELKKSPRKFIWDGLFPPTAENDNAALDEGLVDDLLQRAGEYQKINVSKFEVSGYWRNLQQQPTVTAVVSGKGGVGKTSIALGLCELYSIEENVLLIDFDLHNRGLTSKYGLMNIETSTVLSEMRRFTEKILRDDRLQRDSGKIILSKVDEKLFYDLREKYCYTSYPGAMHLFDLKLEYLYQKSIREEKVSASGARPGNCYFLPSRRGGESYLGTDESRLDAAEIAIFITYLSCLAFRKHGIKRVILDCHGAHDLFMVGAILASSNLVVVTRPELAAFEGTIELVNFAKSIVESQSVFPSTRKLVFNEYRDSDRKVAETMYKVIYKEGNNSEKFDDLPIIESSDDLRDTFKYYQRPSLLQHPKMKKALERITDKHSD